VLFLAHRFLQPLVGVHGEGVGEGRLLGGAGEVARAAFREAMEANARVAGDCCNRGMLVGALLGAAMGARNLPADLVGGLHRAAEVRGAVEAFVHAIVRPQFGPSDVMPPATGAFGEPSSLPPTAYGEHTAVAYPRDFPEKGSAIAADATAAHTAPTDLAWVRGVGPVVLPRSGLVDAVAVPAPLRGDTAAEEAALAQWAAVLAPYRVTAASAGAAGVAEEGDAAADRAAALAALAAGDNGAAASTPPAPPPLPCAPPTAPTAGVAATAVALRTLHAADRDTRHPVRRALAAAVAAASAGEVAAARLGAGVLYHRRPADVAARHRY
jgi:hypothetical protein